MDMKAMMAEQKEEMLRDKYIESEKAGRDLGEPRMVQWTKEHAIAFRREYYRKHLMDLGNGEKPQYFGIFLDEVSKKKIIDILFDGIFLIKQHYHIVSGPFSLYFQAFSQCVLIPAFMKCRIPDTAFRGRRRRIPRGQYRRCAHRQEAS